MLSGAKHLPKFISRGTLAGICKKILRFAQNDRSWTNGGGRDETNTPPGILRD